MVVITDFQLNPPRIKSHPVLLTVDEIDLVQWLVQTYLVSQSPSEYCERAPWCNTR